MAERRFYWLKLQDNFFRKKEIKKLRAIAGGDTYTIIYLKMLLTSLETEGKLFYEGIEEDFASELALELDEETENVKVTVSFLLRTGLLIAGDDTYTLERMQEMTGSESASAERVRRLRDRRKKLHCNEDVTETLRLGNVEKEIENREDIEKDKERDKRRGEYIPEAELPTPAPKESKHKYGEYQHVLLKETEFEKLGVDYGEEMRADAIKFLDEYIEMKGYKAKNHNLCIRKWVVDAVKERQRKQRRNEPVNRVAEELDAFYNMASNWAEGDD